MRQGSAANVAVALSGLLILSCLLILVSRSHGLVLPVLAVGLPMRIVSTGGAGFGGIAVSVARILLGASWLALLLFESRRYWVSLLFSQHLPRSLVKPRADPEDR